MHPIPIHALAEEVSCNGGRLLSLWAIWEHFKVKDCRQGNNLKRCIISDTRLRYLRFAYFLCSAIILRNNAKQKWNFNVVAQWLEQLIDDQKVPGSNHAGAASKLGHVRLPHIASVFRGPFYLLSVPGGVKSKISHTEGNR